MKRERPLSEEKFKEIYSQVPKLTVDPIIETEEGVLMTCRNSRGWVGKWNLPGGLVYMYEHPEEAVKRKVEEETGLQVEVEKFLGYITLPSEQESRGFGYSVSLLFKCKVIGGELVLNDEASEMRFHKEVPENMIPEQREFLEKYLAENQQKFSD